MRARPLPQAGLIEGEGQRAWEVFLQRRSQLTDRMEMETCNGCDACGLRCMQGFTITQAEWEEIQAYLATQPADTVARIQNQQKTVPWVGAEDSGATVTYCQFRDMEKKNCSIYPVRPTICRIFGHTWWLPCPIGAVKHVPEGAETVWENYREFERLTIEEWAQKTGENK